ILVTMLHTGATTSKRRPGGVGPRAHHRRRSISRLSAAAVLCTVLTTALFATDVRLIPTPSSTTAAGTTRLDRTPASHTTPTSPPSPPRAARLRPDPPGWTGGPRDTQLRRRPGHPRRNSPGGEPARCAQRHPYRSSFGRPVA